jgi:hypothetical protein
LMKIERSWSHAAEVKGTRITGSELRMTNLMTVAPSRAILARALVGSS